MRLSWTSESPISPLSGYTSQTWATYLGRVDAA